MLFMAKGFLMTQSRRGLPFLALAVAFLALGVAGNSTFFVLALAFFAISIAFMRLPQR
jgi:hypothetical protein